MLSSRSGTRRSPRSASKGSSVRGEALSALRKRLRAFLTGPEKVAWLETRWAKVYVRKSIRLLHGRGQDYSRCLDLASIEVMPQFQRQGILTGFLDILEKQEGFEAVYVENSMIHSVTDSLRRRGYEEFPLFSIPGLSVCLFKPLGG